MGLLAEIIDALLGGSVPAATVAPPRRRRQARGRRRGRSHRRPVAARFHWHLAREGPQRFHFIRRAGRWVCPICGCT
jgi:hypothetical protein